MSISQRELLLNSMSPMAPDFDKSDVLPSILTRDLAPIHDKFFLNTKKHTLPRFFQRFNRKDFQNLFKCSVAAWGCTILMFINPVLANFGTAVFFAAIVVFILPPAGVTLTILLGGMTMIVGMCLGWAWGVATMKAALAVRSNVEVAALNQRLQKQASATANSTGKDVGVVMQELLFEGFALDTRVTAIYFVMTCVFIYFVSRVRAAQPKITLTQVFAIVVADLFLTTGPLVPSFLGTLPLNLVKPGFVGIGVSMACSLFIFPESTSHLVMESIEKILMPMKDLNDISLVSLQQYPKIPNSKQLTYVLEDMVSAYTEVEGASTFLAIDFSFGRFNADDILSLQTSLKGLIMTFVGLANFHLGGAKTRTNSQEKWDKRPTEVNIDFEMSALDGSTRSQHIERDHLLKRTLNAVEAKSRPLLIACSEGLEVALDGIRQVNSRRWFRQPSKIQCLEMAVLRDGKLQQLKRQRHEFAESNAEFLVEIHDHLFDAEGKVIINAAGENPPLEGIVIGLALETRSLSVADSIIAFLEAFILLEQSRTTSRPWLPSGLRKAASWFAGGAPTPIAALPRSYDDPDEHVMFGEKYKKGSKYKDRARRRPIRERSMLSKIIMATTNWFFCVEGIYAGRVVLATIALGIPAVLPSTAGFYNREKGLWALLMAQTGLMPYMAEFSFGLASKIFGTILGGVIGMIAWYAGSGLGDGNPYGLAGAMSAVIVLGMYFRLRVPQPFLQATILSAATVFLIVANSYVDSRVPTIAPTGVGYDMFFRRTLLILIGCATAGIIQFLPSPTSATVHVSRTLASIISSQASLFSLFTTHPNPKDLQPHIETTLLSTYEGINELQPLLENLKFEFSPSPWNHITLSRISSLTTQLNMHLGTLTHIFSALPPQLRARFELATGCRDIRVISDITAVLGIIDLGMRTSKPLPALLPTPLAEKAIMSKRAEGGKDVLRMVKMADARKYCSAIESWMGFLRGVDDIVVVMKEVLGEWGAWEVFVDDPEIGKT